MKRSSIISLSGLICLIALTSCQKKVYQFNEGTVFGTVYHFTYLAREDLQPGIETELQHVDAELSMFNPNSTLSQFNKHGTTPFDLQQHPWVMHVIEKSLGYSKISDGAFDITVAPLVNVWGFGFRKSGDATQAVIDSMLAFVGYTKLTLKEGCVIKSDARMMLDASAVAKGYACDIVADYLKKQGVTDYMIEIGGEMALSGKNPTGTDWRIGISTPVDDSTSTNQEWKEKLTLTDRCIATSGNYRRFYVKNGKRYAHTIDPHTGYPVQHSLLSATVVAGDCLTADALATAFMVMGVEKALPLAESLPAIEALFICSDDSTDMKVLTTTGIQAWKK